MGLSPWRPLKLGRKKRCNNREALPACRSPHSNKPHIAVGQFFNCANRQEHSYCSVCCSILEHEPVRHGTDVRTKSCPSSNHFNALIYKDMFLILYPINEVWFNALRRSHSLLMQGYGLAKTDNRHAE